MSDAEHQLVLDVRELLEQNRRLAELARRALVAARDAQDVGGAHEPWIDDALAEVESTDGP